MNRKLLAVPILAVLVLVSVVGMSGDIQNQVQKAAGISEGPTYHSAVHVYKNGEMIYQGSNELKDEGKEFIEQELGTGGTSYVIDQIVLGNGSSATGNVAQTSHPDELASCGMSAGTVTFSSVGTGNMTASSEWTSTCDDQVVNTTGLVCSGCDPDVDYFAGDDITKTTLQTDDKLNVTWYVWVT